MEWVVGAALLGVAAWIIAEPFRRAREARRTGQPSLPFSRMLTRMVVAFCLTAIVVMAGVSPYLLQDKHPLIQLLYWLAALVLALTMLVAGMTEMALVKKQLLEQERDLVRQVIRPKRREMRAERERKAPEPAGRNGKGEPQHGG